MKQLQTFAYYEKLIDSKISQLSSVNMLNNLHSSHGYNFNTELLESSFKKVVNESLTFSKDDINEDIWKIALRSVLESRNYNDISSITGNSWQEDLKKITGNYTAKDLYTARSSV